VLGLSIGAVLCSSACDETPRPTAEVTSDESRLNLLLITVDTLRADHLSGYGYERPTTPNLDRFLASAVIFEDAQSNSGWTMPSLASTMTSLHPSTHGCVHFNSRLDDSHRTLAEIVRDAGYRTHAIGSHVFLSESRGLQQGFSEFDDELIRRREATDRDVSSAAISDKAIEWLGRRFREQGERRPWMLWLHYFDPHTAYVAHPDFEDLFGSERPIDRYDGEVAFTDRELARVLVYLEDEGAAGRTLVAFLSDHGEAFGEHGSTRHSTHLFDEVTHIPFAIRDPRIPGRRVISTVESLDLLPTLLELLDIESGGAGEFAGRSLVASMRGEEISERAILAQTEMFSRYRADSLTLGRWKLIADRSGGLARSGDGRVRVRARSEAIGAPAYYLFDRRSGNAIDVAAENARVVEVLEKELVRIRTRAESAAPTTRGEARLELGEDERGTLEALGYIDAEPPM
jgi:arylsulfatase A-like enzyme